MIVKVSHAYSKVEVDKPGSIGNLTLPQGGESCNRTMVRLAMVDLAIVDLALLDLALVDLAMVDLAIVDQYMVDLAMVDQSMVDMAIADLSMVELKAFLICTKNSTPSQNVPNARVSSETSDLN